MMNKGQIVKIKLSDNGSEKPSYQGYGICINPEKNWYVLENGNLLFNKGTSPDYAKYLNSTSLLQVKNVLSGHDTRRPYDNVEVSATRNVPEGIRTSLTEMGKGVVFLFNEAKKYVSFMEQFEQNYNKQKENIEKQVANIRENRGVLTKKEFAEEFISNLSPSVKEALKHGECRGYGGPDGYWRVDLYVNLQIHRSVWIDKYIGDSQYDFTRREYDGCLMIDEPTKEYKRILAKYRKELPVKDKLHEEYLTIGDKESLEYEAMYLIKIDQTKPLTKAYAKELADKFCGVKKERVQKETNKEDIDYER